MILNIDWTCLSAIGTLVSALVAIFYTIFTYQLLESTKKTVSTNNKLVEFQIYNEIVKQLNSELVKDILEKCENNTLIIDSKNSNQICRSILNPIEDLAKFYDDGLVSADSIDSGFGTVILLLGNNSQITDLIQRERKLIKNLYDGFERLYNLIYKEYTSDDDKIKFKSQLFL